MKKNFFSIYFVIGILILLLGASVVTSMSGNNEKLNTIQNENGENRIYNEKSLNCADPTLVFVEQMKLLASDGVTQDYFGNSVSIDGDYAFVGAPLDDDKGADSGSVYVFKRTGTVWSQETKLLASDGEDYDNFGISASVNGDYALIGALCNESESGGSAYVFKLDGSNWIEEDILSASDPEYRNYFGFSVSLDRDYALIGAPRDNGAGGADYGSAYVFKRDGTTWSEEDKLTDPDGGAIQDDFGISVSLNGDYALIGEFWDDDNGMNSGSAFVFKRDGTNWNYEAKLLASNGAAGDHFGRSVSLDGNYALIGAPDDHDDYGYVYVFKRDGIIWTEEEYLTASDIELGDAFGISVSLDGDTALIGSYGADEPEDSGSAYVFIYDGGNWNELGKLDASDETVEDAYGFSVSLDGDYALIGSLRDDDNGENSGSAYVFYATHPPEAPDINGPLEVKVGTSYEYSFTSTDQDSDDIAEYYIDWGDENEEIIAGPFVSGTPAITDHAWENVGVILIKAKAKDIHGAESGWGELQVNVPRNKGIQTLPFLNFQKNLPNLFPILRLLLQQLGLQ